MAKKNNNTDVNTRELSPEELKKRQDALDYVHQDRRYVGTKETVAYILNDSSANLNIGEYNDRYIYDIVKIDFRLLALQNSIAGVWDVFNDIFIGVIVEKTRTRWGKFKPWLLFGKIPLTILGLWSWFVPMLFPGMAGDYLPKWIFYFVMSVVTETAGTFSAIAGTGFMATITPHPVERTRLLTQANLISSLFENGPNLLFGVLYDLTINNITGWNLYHLFLSFALPLAALSCALSFYYVFVAKERIMQTIERPSVKMGLKAILTNKPILLLCLSDFLQNFSVGKGRTNYYIDVLGSSSYKTLVGIPASPLSYISYSFITPIRRKFSTKAIWIMEDLWTDMCWLIVFVIGSINKNFKNKWIMLPVMAIEECLEMCVYGLRKVIPNEIRNEAMDYCEWKLGYRAEAMTGVAKDLILKLQGVFMGTINNLIMQAIGYVQGQEIGTQTDRTKWWIFAMGTGIPVITGALGIIPKFFYPLHGERRDAMYADLIERRRLMAERVTNANAEELLVIAQEERKGTYIQNTYD